MPPESPQPSSFDAVLLAGGRATRLDGVDKTALGGREGTLLDRAVAAAAGARRLVVVGLRDAHRAPPVAVLVREDPPFGGPVAALAAALRSTADHAPDTLVLACDLVRPVGALAALRRAHRPEGSDGVLAVDDDGRRQPLLGIYRTASLLAALDALPGVDGASLRRLTAPLRLTEVPVPSALCADVDTPEDADRLTRSGSHATRPAPLLD